MVCDDSLLGEDEFLDLLLLQSLFPVVDIYEISLMYIKNKINNNDFELITPLK
jgi:hypothetical protein